jgi:oxygen-independent coproporphyrinogen III oxidase
MAIEQPASLYIHIPFCQLKCAYCDFNSYPGLEMLHQPYVCALSLEMALYQARYPELALETIYIGGGTPTVLPQELLAQTLQACRQHFQIHAEAEISVEANPGTVDERKLDALRRAGVNRLSLGAQSLNDRLLRLIGRIHNAEQVAHTFRLARGAGYDNINLDLMYGLPEQSTADWQDTLAKALALSPEHLSLYALTLHDETPLAQRIARGALSALDDDLAADMYSYARSLLAANGYEHYEISNWAKRTERAGRSFRCRHNLTYWLDQTYIGIGAGAHSYCARQRYWNVSRPEEYIRRLATGGSPIADSEDIGRRTEISEFMILGLRLIEGVTDERFARRFGCEMRSLYASEIDALAAQGLLIVARDRIRLSERGHLLGNEVFERFLLQPEGGKHVA